MRIPFCPLPAKSAKKLLSTSLYGVAESLLKVFPSLELELKQAEFDINARDYVSIAIFSSVFMFVVTYAVFVMAASMTFTLDKTLPLGFLVGMIFFGLTFFYIRIYPKLVIKKRVLDIEKNLIYALRHMYVQITAGVTVFDALASVSSGNYGSISSEFKSAVKSVETGVPLDKALEDLTLKNPSQYFRRSVWQISNSVKTGSDLSGVLKSIVDYLSSEQRIMIKRYGSQLNPLTLVYLMIAVIVPTLGVTFLIVLSSFSKIPVTETIFWMILGALILFQFMFIGILKSKRPNLV